MRTSILAVSVAVTLSIVAAARPSAQSSGLDALIQKAKEKLAKPKIVECASNDQVCIDNARKAGAAVKLVDPPAPPPASGQNSRPAAPTPLSSAGGNQAAGTGFDAPEVDHPSLFKLFIAANADVLGDNKSVAWEHYLLFRVPPGVEPQRYSPECVDLQNKVRNEITAQTVLDNAVRDFKQALVALQSGPRTAVFTLRTTERLKVYDTAKSVFQLDTIGSSMLVDGAKISISRDGGPVYMMYLSRSPRTRCSVPVATGPGLKSLNGFSGFTLKIEGQERLLEWPMDRAAAEAYLNANTRRMVDLEVAVDVGPAPMAENPMPARIVAARLLNPPDGRVLHTFNIPGARITSTAASGGAATTESGNAGGAVLFTANRGLLLTVRDQPARITQEALLQATRKQVAIEQMVWKQVDLLRNPNYGAGVPAARWNPKRAVFTYEWQTVIERQPDVARGPLLDMFLRPDPDWSIVTRDPAWDTRFVALVVPTLFARERVEGRDPTFAAQELAPVYKRHLELAASKAPTKFWFPMTLPSYTYDFATHEIRFPPQTNYRGKPSTIGGTDFLPIAADDTRGLVEYVLPPTARNLAPFPVGSGGGTQRLEAAPTNPGYRLGAQDATDAWRHAFVIGSSDRSMPMVEALALDRRIQITSLPMEPARAEALAKRMASSTNKYLSARVYFDADHVEMGERVFDGARSPTAILVGKIEKIEILDFDNGLITTITASELPPPAVATPPPAPAGPPPAPAAATPRRPTAAETEADVQRRNAENSQKVSEALNRDTAEKIRKGMEAIEKDTKCRADATKVNRDPQSKAYKDAYAACQAAK